MNLKNEVNIEMLLLEVRRLNTDLSGGLDDLEQQMKSQQLQIDLSHQIQLENELNRTELEDY